MRRPALALFAILLMFAGGYSFTPDKPAPKKMPEKQLLNLSGDTNWGKITHVPGAITFTFDGHPSWSGTGTIQENGNVIIIWTHLATDEPCPGLYKLEITKEGNLLSGVWGYSHSGVKTDGKIIEGPTMGDRVYKVTVIY